MRTVLRLTFGLALALGLYRPLAARAQPSFSDVPVGNGPPSATVHALTAEGILAGYPDGTFGGRRAMTRREFALALWRTVMNGEQRLATIRPVNTPAPLLAAPPEAGLFADVPTGSTLGDVLRDLGARGIIEGYADQTFAGWRPVTRGECQTALRRTFQWVEHELAAIQSTPAGGSPH